MQSCLDYELIKLVYSTETTCTSDSDPITKSSVLKDYSDIFKGVGLVSGKATIHIDSEVPPVVHPPGRVPVALRGRLKSELDRMVNADNICKVNGPTPWVNSLVVVEKPNGKLRDGKDPYVVLLEYRTTPLDIGYTPSQLLMCRKLRSVLPTTLEGLVPKTPIYNEVQNKIDCKKSCQKKYYNQGSKPLKSLNSGDSVRIRGSNGLWKPAIISSQHSASRSYIVESQDGGIYRRNRRHIIGTREEDLTLVQNI
ncbi:unnamed protein product [Mytilus edulis]|uniref:Uncharacterized protein n=1 Tax=Mytilus edulis TaxID=6550 RepID=A0A8S3TH21_MYTED|nr:unnamed protein product [Mytilus edulis]